MRKETVVIAASRGPFRAVAKRLAKQKYRVVFIDKPSQLTRRRLTQLSPIYVFLPHWSFIVPADVYENFECVIFHMTDVPYGRGGSPLQNLILRGHKKTKMSALRCGAVLDGGDVYMKRPFGLEGSAGEIYTRMAILIEEMIQTILKRRPRPVAQKGKAVVFRRRKPEESNLVHAASPKQIFDFIRMLDADGYPRAFLELAGSRFEFSSAALRNNVITADVKIIRRKQ